MHTVELNLERHIGPLSKALVKKAARKTSNVEELTELLARFIPSERDKTVFLAKTQVLSGPETLGEHPPSAEAQSTIASPAKPSQRHEPKQAPTPLDDAILKAAEENLAAYVGPMAKVLVKKAARRTSDLDEFCRILAEELPDEQRRNAFTSAIKRRASSRKR